MSKSGTSSLLSASRINWILMKLRDIVNHVPMVRFNRPQKDVSFVKNGVALMLIAAAPIWHPKRCANGEKTFIPKTETLILHFLRLISNLSKKEHLPSCSVQQQHNSIM